MWLHFVRDPGMFLKDSPPVSSQMHYILIICRSDGDGIARFGGNRIKVGDC